jgi:ABC-type sugar transport system ATPase subunit
VLTAEGIVKQYGGVRALAGVDLSIRPGEIQALLGANGAGKSTLVKILVGAERPTSGQLVMDGEPLTLRTVIDANAHGIAIVSQELTLYPHLDVLQNLFLLDEPRVAGVLLDRRAMTRRALEVLETVGLRVDLTRPVGSLRLAEQQLIEIARALLKKPRVLLLDEPTSALQAAETARLLDLVRRLRDDGVAIVYVSHFLEDVFEIADTITVVRNGQVVADRVPRAEMTIKDAVREMLGDAARPERIRSTAPVEVPDDAAARGPLRLTGASVTGQLDPLDLEVRPGEIVGLAGLEGSGPNVVLDILFGRRRLDAGRVELPGGDGAPRSMARAVQSGIAYVPADRKQRGVMLEKSILENIATVSAGALGRMGLMPSSTAMESRAGYWAKELGIKMSGPAQLVGQLSGGNQQKVVFAKWLEARPRIVLLDDPSRGVDVGAKADMHGIVDQVARQGAVVLVASSDLDELATMCSRVVVFYRGACVGELAGEGLDERRLLEAINTGAI